MLGDCVSRLRISQGTNGRLKSNVQYGLNSSTLGELWRRHRAGRLKSLSADVIRLEALVERDRAAPDPDDQTRINLNQEFHVALWGASHNPVLMDLLARLSTHLIHTPRSTLSVGNRWQESLDEHEALVRAVADRRADDARRIARSHMETARTLRLQLLRTSAAG